MFLLILLVAVLIGGIVICIRERDGFFMLPTVVLLLIVFLVVGTLCSCIGICIEADEVYQVDETDILAFNDSVGSDGHFFLGGGSIDSKMYYYYLTENDDGSNEIHKIANNDVTVYDDEPEYPCIVTIHSRSSSGILNFFFCTERSRTEIHIPPSSVKYDFVIDLK